jgi:hypothetical protein
MRYERESIEFQPITVTVDGAVVTTGVTFAITPNGTRPLAYSTPTMLGGKAGVMVQGLQPGVYNVWAKVASTPETVVVNCGPIVVT